MFNIEPSGLGLCEWDRVLFRRTYIETQLAYTVWRADLLFVLSTFYHHTYSLVRCRQERRFVHGISNGR